MTSNPSPHDRPAEASILRAAEQRAIEAESAFKREPKQLQYLIWRYTLRELERFRAEGDLLNAVRNDLPRAEYEAAKQRWAELSTDSWYGSGGGR